MDNIKLIDKDITNETDSDLVNNFLFGSSKYKHHINSKILNLSIDFILKKGFPVNYFENSTMSITQIY